MGKRHLYGSKHPFNANPFEAFCCDSWRTVELIRIEDGTMTMQFADNQYVYKEKGPFSNLRIKSRKTTLSDCTCFLRPGVDICVFSTSQQTESSDEEDQEPVWLDAKIASIERKPHESRCECQFYVNFYVKQTPLGQEKGLLNKDIIKVVELDQIAILQKLQRYPSQAEHYRWDSSEDSSQVQRTKLFLGRFSSDLTWLLVASVLRQSAFDVRSVENKIVYEIRGGDHQKSLSKSEKNSNAVNFKTENELLIPFIVPFVSTNSCEAGMHEGGPSPASDPMGLRRSKRRYVQPDRFLGCDDISDSEIGSVRTGLFVTKKRKDEDELPLALLFHAFTPSKYSEKPTKGQKKVNSLAIVPSKNTFPCKKKSTSKKVKSEVGNRKEIGTELAIVPLATVNDPAVSEQNPLIFGNGSGEIRDLSSRSCFIRDPPTTDTKNSSDIEDMDFDCRGKGNASDKKGKRRRYHHTLYSRKESFNGAKPFNKRTLTANMYYEVVRSYMKNIESTIKKEEPNVINQWRFQTTNCPGPKKACDATTSINDEEETSEIEMLWREFELALTSCYLHENDEGPNNENDMENSSEDDKKPCRHEYKLDEEIGLLCKLCGFVSTEIKDVSPPFLQYNSVPNNKSCTEEDTEYQQTEGDDLDFTCTRPSTDMPLSEGKANVWNLIPDLRDKLHFHQKKAFEFLWRNIAGSLVPALMDPDSKNRGGCVISHTPGAGKTFLIIAFLVSYLKLFPGKRPLVLAPKTTLYTWYKEIIKWEVPIPVYQIHNGRTYRMLKQKAVVANGAPQPGNDIMHVLDCLDKIRKWHDHPSILIMGYTSFLTLTREDSRMPHRRYMCEVLRQSPGILVLDEGHNPRSTKSRLRKALMKVETDLRVLLSGTLFQNNFGEYFNTLCLARPKFVNEVLMELDPKFRKQKKLRKPRSLMENRARKFFIEKIAIKINSSKAEERIEGLNMLKNTTNGFIDVYEGGSSENLPGLQSYTLLMKSSSIQQEIMERLHKERAQCKRFPLELELLITLGSIHPCLIKTACCANKYFSVEELEEFDKHRLDLRKGSKLKFVVSLVTHCISNREKVLIFCHNIAPINFLLEIFSNVYGWRKGKEVLVLQGDLELFERGRVMDKFEEVGGASKVLLASITACAEGVSLTAASRVILLDSEWNPSKTKQAIARAFRPGQQKMVYVYQLLATGTLEEEKYDRTTWKEWVSNMIFSEELVEDPSRWQKEKIEDDVLRDIVEEDWAKSFHMIMKNEKASKD